MSEAYREAGVDIDAGDEAARRYQTHAARTWRPEALTALGSFGGAFALLDRYPNPVLVSGTDGVGTKLKIAFALGRHDTVGIDCVAMCVNDIAVMGAEPLFFLDYLAMGRLDPAVAEQVVRGVAEGCAQAGCALIGGETAELPGIYQEGEYDLAGFAVGIVNRHQLIDGSATADSDVVIGLASSGLHSNGFSLVRKLIGDAGIALDAPTPTGAIGVTLGEELLTPTRIYSPTALALCREFPVHGMAHITGGGLTDNLPRILHRRWDVELDVESWRISPVFSWLERLGDLSDDDLFRTFNMGVGFVVIVPVEVADGVVARANELGERATRIGVVRAGEGRVQRRGSWRDSRP
ncbi:MAG TPA: phosphoribosylformylglycinamidine cyclo-ligase [Ktedonobacterales bacterium]|jgi:phosphoribosylformylglycinamidine cyclo-ligase